MNRDESWQVIDEQRLVIADLLETLTPQEWATPSLCDAWTVREVGAHLSLAATAKMDEMLRFAIRARGNFDVSIREATIARAAARSNAEIIADLRNIVGSQRLTSRDLLARPVARRPGARSGSEPPDRPPRWRCRSRPPGPPPTGPGSAGSRSLPRDDSAASGWSQTTSTGPGAAARNCAVRLRRCCCSRPDAARLWRTCMAPVCGRRGSGARRPGSKPFLHQRDPL